MIRVILPAHLRQLAGCGREVTLDADATQRGLLEALELRYPTLRGKLRDPVTEQRHRFVRLYACGEDLSQQPLESPLPTAVAEGSEPLRILSMMAGG